MLKTPIYINVSSIISRLKLFHTELILYSNDVLEINLGEDFYYTIKEAREISGAIDKISLGRQRKVMLIAGAYSNCDHETRKFISSREICQKISAMTLIPSSLAQNLIARFVVNFDRPSVPAKVFNRKDDALNWLLNLNNP